MVKKKGMLTSTPQFKFPFPKDKFIFVFWKDAYVTVGSIEDPVDCTISSGVKVKEDDDYIYLSHFYCGIEKGFSEPYTSIPKGMIKKIISMKDIK